MAKLNISPGNTKLGKIPSFSIPAIDTCPGKTEWCASKCYADRISRMYKNAANSYTNNLTQTYSTSFVSDMDASIKKLLSKGTTTFRLHVSGDLMDNDYITKWIDIVDKNPTMTFYAYTRSWRVPELLPKLEELHSKPNMKLFASTDLDTINANEQPPSTWRVAYAGDIKPTNSVQCLEQTKTDYTCEACTVCYNKSSVNIYFKTH